MEKRGVKLLVEFDQRGLVPRVLKLRGRKYRIEKVNLIHSITDGLVRVYFFSVSDRANYWKLGFNTETLRWWVEDQYSV